jgi:hypothetical protein
MVSAQFRNTWEFTNYTTSREADEEASLVKLEKTSEETRAKDKCENSTDKITYHRKGTWEKHTSHTKKKQFSGYLERDLLEQEKALVIRNKDRTITRWTE